MSLLHSSAGPNDVADDRQSNDTDTFIFGCLFEDCYAGKKGGGMTKRAGGKMSVLQSGFYNNSAGSDSVKDGEMSLS